MNESLHQDGEYMDAAIDEAVGSLTRGEAPIGLRRDVLARIESRPPVMWRTRRLAFGSMALAALAVLGVFMVQHRGVPAPQVPVPASALALRVAPLPEVASREPLAQTHLAAALPSPRSRVATPAVSTRSAVADSAMAVRVSALPTQSSIDPAPLDSLKPVAPRPIAIDPIGVSAIVVPPLGASQAPQGDHQ